jgi:hypothetical protein
MVCDYLYSHSESGGDWAQLRLTVDTDEQIGSYGGSEEERADAMAADYLGWLVECPHAWKIECKIKQGAKNV